MQDTHFVPCNLPALACKSLYVSGLRLDLSTKAKSLHATKEAGLLELWYIMLMLAGQIMLLLHLPTSAPGIKG